VAIAGTSPVSTAKGDYVPAVGDEVEFDRPTKLNLKGIIFDGYGGSQLGVIDSSHSSWYLLSNVSNIKKIGDCRKMTAGICVDTAYAIAKAYFAQPTFKKGDRVKIVRKYTESEGTLVWNPDKNRLIGEVCEISYIDNDGEAVFEDSWCFPFCCLEPA